MVSVDPFNQECYEVLEQENPELIFKVAEMVADGATPDQVRELVAEEYDNSMSAMPIIARNAANYLVGVTPPNKKPLIH